MGIKGGNRQESGYTLHCRTFHFLSLSFSLRCFRHKTLKYVKFDLKSKTIAFSCKKWPWKSGLWSSLEMFPAALKICIEQTVKLGQLMLGESPETSAVLIQNMQSLAEICT